MSISLSLVAVFIPILLMGGIVGRLFREFAVTLSVAIVVSMVVSLTTTPMMCARLLRAEGQRDARPALPGQRAGVRVDPRVDTSDSLRWVLRHQRATLLVTLATMAATVYLYAMIPKGFFPAAGHREPDRRDSGRSGHLVPGDAAPGRAVRGHRPARSRRRHGPGLRRRRRHAEHGADVRQSEAARRAPRSRRRVIARLRGKLAAVPGATLYLQAVQDLRIGGRASNAQYQYTLQGESVKELNDWAPRVYTRLRTLPQLADVNSDQQKRGLEASLAIDRSTASRLGITTQMIDDTLYDAFGQRPVSTMYTQLNQYHVVMEVEPRFWQNPDALEVHLRALERRARSCRSARSHTTRRRPPRWRSTTRGSSRAVTISFNLAPGVALGDAVAAIDAGRARDRRAVEHRRKLPGHGAGVPGLAGHRAHPDRRGDLLTVYIVLGMLYESYVHPITILSTLPSAGVGALLALLICRHRSHRDRPHRDHPAHRDREEERHPDDRFRARRRAHGREASRGGDLPGVPAAVPADHDDDDGGAARRPAAGARHRDRVGAAAARSASRLSAA